MSERSADAAWPVRGHDRVGTEFLRSQHVLVEPVFLETLGHLRQIDRRHRVGQFVLVRVASSAVEPLIANQFQPNVSALFRIVDDGKLGFRKFVGCLKQFNQMSDVLFAILRHSGCHVGANRSSVHQDVAHPFRIQFGTNTGKCWRNSSLFAKIQICGLKVSTTLLADSAKVIATVTGGAAKRR